MFIVRHELSIIQLPIRLIMGRLIYLVSLKKEEVLKCRHELYSYEIGTFLAALVAKGTALG
jgi:hypothetical protein